MKRKKQDNNLVLVNLEGNKYYFTSFTKAGTSLGLEGNAAVQYHCRRQQSFTLKNGKKVEISLVDGSEIPYKLINNEIEGGE